LPLLATYDGALPITALLKVEKLSRPGPGQ
jgi:hypothetical protein